MGLGTEEKKPTEAKQQTGEGRGRSFAPIGRKREEWGRKGLHALRFTTRVFRNFGAGQTRRIAFWPLKRGLIA